ncbi:thioredoxin family protein [Agromyces sp. NPDC058484]|uniref:thioredoxin family protein n=1 Tax=Agromyces sp. NPDC058484 TaxID=3346524 RepID=UPI003666266F
MHARTSRAAAVLVAVLALSGCAASSTDAASSPPAVETTAPSPTTTPVPTTSAPPADAVSEAPQPAATPGAYVDYTDGVIEATTGAKALFFHASWCPKCRALEEDLLTAGVPDGLTVFKVDYDSRTDLRQRYGVTLQTTIVFVDDTGDAISSTVLYDDPSVASLVAAMPD